MTFRHIPWKKLIVMFIHFQGTGMALPSINFTTFGSTNYFQLFALNRKSKIVHLSNRLLLIMKFYVHFFAIILFFNVSCSKTENGNPSGSIPPNILLIIADDLGKDAINGYPEGAVKPKTPHLDNIRNQGISFNQFWADPTCTPTRSTIITGKYGYRTGVKAVGDILGTSETLLQKYISDNTNHQYTTAVIGKWHLSGNNNDVNPENYGIDYYAGLIKGTVDDYYNWEFTEDKSTIANQKYTTEFFTDLAIDWVSQQSKPWFLWLAYNAPHTPFHIPPSHMHSQGSLPNYVVGLDPTPYYMASIEAMDYQIGRFLDTLSNEARENTVIIFLGDNGTTNEVVQSPYKSVRSKNTVYQAGVNVPLFIAGKNVVRKGTDDNLLNSTDLFATISEIAGLNVPQYNDSKSFKILLAQNQIIRDYQYTEINDGSNESWAISNGKYKLIVKDSGKKELYDLSTDPYESNNLLDKTLTTTEREAKLELEAELEKIRL